MFLPLLPLKEQKSLQHSEPEARDREIMLDSTLAEDMELLHGDIPCLPQSDDEGRSSDHTSTTDSHQTCKSKYYHSITPKTNIHSTQKKLKDGCLFSYFKPSARNLTSTPETAVTASSISERSSDAASLVSTAPSEDSESQDETDEVVDHFTALGESNAPPAVPDGWEVSGLQETAKTKQEPSDGEEETKVPEHVTPAESTMNGNVADHEESLLETLAVQTPAAFPFGSGSVRDGVPGDQPGINVSTADSCSDDNHRISEDLAKNVSIPIEKEECLNHVLPSLTQQAGTPNIAENSAKDARQADTAVGIEPAITGGHHQEQEDSLVNTTLSPDLDDTELQARQGSVEGSALNCSMIQNATLHFKSEETRTGSSAGKVVEEPAQGPFTDATLIPSLSTAEVPLIPNLERPDMSWASDSPVAFTSSFPKPSVDKKIDELRARAEAALLRRQILRQYAAQQEQQVEGEEAAMRPAPPAQEKEDAEIVPKSGKISNRKKQRQAAKAKRQAESSGTAVVTPNHPALSSAIMPTAPSNSQHTDEEKYNSTVDDFKVEARPTKRVQRARAYAASQEKKAQELKAAQELKKLQEKEAEAQLAAAPVLTAAAKRRNRQKRNQGGRSYADALKL